MLYCEETVRVQNDERSYPLARWLSRPLPAEICILPLAPPAYPPVCAMSSSSRTPGRIRRNHAFDDRDIMQHSF